MQSETELTELYLRSLNKNYRNSSNGFTMTRESQWNSNYTSNEEFTSASKSSNL